MTFRVLKGSQFVLEDPVPLDYVAELKSGFEGLLVGIAVSPRLGHRMGEKDGITVRRRLPRETEKTLGNNEAPRG